MNLLGRETRPRLVLRAVVLVAPVLALLAARPTDLPHGWFVALTLVLSVGFAWMPESALGTICLGLVVFWWALAAADGVPLGAIPAALLLLAAHLASVLLSYGPPALPVGTALLGRWLRRGVVRGRRGSARLAGGGGGRRPAGAAGHLDLRPGVCRGRLHRRGDRGRHARE